METRRRSRASPSCSRASRTLARSARSGARELVLLLLPVRRHRVAVARRHRVAGGLAALEWIARTRRRADRRGQGAASDRTRRPSHRCAFSDHPQGPVPADEGGCRHPRSNDRRDQLARIAGLDGCTCHRPRRSSAADHTLPHCRAVDSRRRAVVATQASDNHRARGARRVRTELPAAGAGRNRGDLAGPFV